ncbi:AP180 N-terminal homology (ANTH) domain [Macleaya cordata]|uniref:AP180 N-terminal homology (ANTH) domain n=1 Tax=Macleaya cordata TaxID=56857 RepID=A0A200PYD3_MACCD|nr:AP180 N-terminal homology (ANTH) domain [Macleaya cordata]
MKVLKKASAVLKDKNSIFLAKLAKKTAYRNPDLETAIIKATSHDESKIDYKNAQRVFTWVRTSPTSLKPLIWSLSTRMNKTRSWVVALKGLMLMHGIFCCKVPAFKKIGRLPFDQSNFHDGHSKSPRIWALSAFVRSYFAFLDTRSALDSHQADEEQRKRRPIREGPMVQVLEELSKSQHLLDMLIQIRPDGINCYTLILEAMDCIIVEIFDVYSRICSGIAGILVGVLGASQLEAKMALRILKKAASQGEELSSYFEFCKDIGVLNASEFPRVEQIPEEDIRDLERIIMNGVSEKKKMSRFSEENKKDLSRNSSSKTIVTDNWVVFDDDFRVDHHEKVHQVIKNCPSVEMNTTTTTTTSYVDPFAASLNYPPLLVCGYEDGYTNSNGNFLQMGQYYHSNHLHHQGALSANNCNNQTNLILSL